MNILIVIMIAGGCLLAVFAIVGIWEKRDKKKLLNLALRVSETDREPETIFWGNNCLILFYMQENFIVAALDSEARMIPVSSIVDCSCTVNSSGGGAGRITMTLNDPINPDISMMFPDNEAAHVQSAIASFMSQNNTQTPVIIQEILEEPLSEEDIAASYDDEKIYRKNVIQSDSEQHIIMEKPNTANKGQNVIIDNF